MIKKDGFRMLKPKGVLVLMKHVWDIAYNKAYCIKMFALPLNMETFTSWKRPTLGKIIYWIMFFKFNRSFELLEHKNTQLPNIFHRSNIFLENLLRIMHINTDACIYTFFIETEGRYLHTPKKKHFKRQIVWVNVQI